MVKKNYLSAFFAIMIMIVLSGCSHIGDKGASLSAVYGTTLFLSVLMLVGYISAIRKKEIWFLVLFVSVVIVNAGYLCISISDTVEKALWANRLAYLGSVFLPFSMIMIILNVTKFSYKKWFPVTLGIISVLVFLVAASPGYLDIYYKSVSFEIIKGVSVLSKEYGTWHFLYLIYLMTYFLIMIASIIYAIISKKIESVSHAVILIVAVFVNICVWMLEQLVEINFEFLSVSYIITELFLIGVYLMIQQHETILSLLKEKKAAEAVEEKKYKKNNSEEFNEICRYIAEQLSNLTPTERKVYNCYIEGMSTKEVLKELNISENTLKFHNKNLYGKLGVSSRKQLRECSTAVQKINEEK